MKLQACHTPPVKPYSDICLLGAGSARLRLAAGSGATRGAHGARDPERIATCASQPWPAEWAVPASCAVSCTTSGGPTQRPPPETRPEVTVIGNTGDDITLFGLRVCPDLDTLLYTLGGCVHEGQGWGRDDESHHVAAELAALGATPQWFTLGDKDFATHIYRSQLLGQGMPLSSVTARLADRWGLGEQGVTLLPMTDTPVETHVVVTEDDEHAGHPLPGVVGAPPGRAAGRAVRRGRAGPAAAGPGVLEAIRSADVILLPPSNPVVSIGIILGVPGVRDAHARHAGPRGRRLAPRGRSPGPRPCRRLPADDRGRRDERWRRRPVRRLPRRLARRRERPEPVRAGSSRATVLRRPLLMTSVEAAADIAGAALDLALDLRGRRGRRMISTLAEHSPSASEVPA